MATANNYESPGRIDPLAPTNPEAAHLSYEEHHFFQHGPPMEYLPPQYPGTEISPVLVTPLSKLHEQPTQVDCPYCKKSVMTETRKTASNTSEFAQFLLCIVFYPLVFCYEVDDRIDHHCSVCEKRLAYKPREGSTVVVAQPNVEDKVPSKYQPAV